MHPWTADIGITRELAAELLAQQFPHLAGLPVEPLGEGWDNAAFSAGEYVFRFPRRKIAAALIETEVAILPRIAGELPLAISVPVLAGVAGETYPWPFAGYRRLPGTAVCALRPPEDAYGAIAAQLGAFLRALHAIDPAPAIAAGIGGDTIGRLDHTARMPRLDERFAELERMGLLREPQPLLDFLNDVAPSGPRSPGCIVHGDLYAAHVLIGNGAVTGIIDWGDVHLGDPALDVSVAFETLPPSARGAFFTAYGGIDRDTERLARYRAIYHAALVAHYGVSIGNGDLRDAGLRGLGFARA